MLKKTMLLGSMLCAALGAAVSPVSAEQTATAIDAYYVPMHFTFDGKEYAPSASQQGFIWEGSTYVPLRFVSYSLGKAVDWDQATYTVTVRKPNLAEQVSIDDYKLNATVRGGGDASPVTEAGSPTEVQAYFETVHYVFDGKETAPPEDKPGLILDGTLYVPIRFYSESVGQTIGWDQSTYTVSAQSPGAAQGTVHPGGDPMGTSGGATTGSGSSAGGTTSSSGGAVAPAPVTQASIEAETEAQLAAMRSDAQNYFMGLALSYLREPVRDAAVKANYMAQGQAALSGYDSQFSSIMSDLAAKLTANGYDSAASVKKYTDQYESEKAAAESSLGSLAH